VIVLALDTATEELAIGVGRWDAGSGEVLGSHDLRAPRSANTRLLPEVATLLAAHGLSAADIGAVVVGRGPGSFTGVRIGVATAKGMAHGRGVPLFGVGTPDAVAARLRGHDGLVGVVGDAMRSEVYPVLFRVLGGRVQRLTPDIVAGPAEVARQWASEIREPLTLTGNGLAKYAEVFGEALGDRAVLAPEALWTPSGESLLIEAFATCDLTARPDAGTLLPVYTRLSDAEELERRRLAAGGTCVPESGVAGPGDAGTAS